MPVTKSCESVEQITVSNNVFSNKEVKAREINAFLEVGVGQFVNEGTRPNTKPTRIG
jgi:hypothetical protein